MTNNELLLAISNMLDPIREDIRELKEDVRELKEDVRKIEERVGVIEDRVETIEERVGAIEEHVREIDERLKKVELTQENIVIPRLQNIESCYTSTFERYKTSVEEHEQIKEDVFLLKQVVMEHSEKLQKIS